MDPSTSLLAKKRGKATILIASPTHGDRRTQQRRRCSVTGINLVDAPTRYFGSSLLPLHRPPKVKLTLHRAPYRTSGPNSSTIKSQILAKTRHESMKNILLLRVHMHAFYYVAILCSHKSTWYNFFFFERPGRYISACIKNLYLQYLRMLSRNELVQLPHAMCGAAGP